MNVSKICTKCHVEKLLTEFSKHKHCKYGVRSYCKLCGQNDRKIWYARNQNKAKATCAKYYENNSAAIKQATKIYNKNRRQIDLGYRLKLNLRRRINNALHGNNKTKRTMELIGCTVEQLKDYLSKSFQAGMTWENYGKWHIDHIKPCASFDLTIPKQQEACFHYSNLQPLWAKDNLTKSSSCSPFPEFLIK